MLFFRISPKSFELDARVDLPRFLGALDGAAPPPYAPDLSWNPVPDTLRVSTRCQ